MTEPFFSVQPGRPRPRERLPGANLDLRPVSLEARRVVAAAADED
jgi:hypothetical protein